MATQIIMPEMGEGVVEGTIVQWLKHEGDQVQADEPVLEIETDKVTVEVNAESSGVLLKINVEEGQTVSAGTVLAVIGQEGEKVGKSAPPAQTAAPESVRPEPVSGAHVQKAAPPPSNGTENHVPAQVPAQVPSAAYPPETASETASETVYETAYETVRVSPVVARMAEEHQIDLSRIRGTGLHGRITKNDVLAYLENPPAAPAKPRSVPRTVTPSEPERVESAVPALAAPAPAAPAVTGSDERDIVPLTSLRRNIASHMVKSVQTSPHATTFFEFDFSAVAHHRAKHKAEFAAQGVKLTYMPYIMQSVVYALLKHPVVNGSWTDEGILLKKEIHLGMAVAIDDGLIVPVIRRADELNLLGMARMVNDLAERARTNKLKPDEVRGATFTVSNHGASGSLAGTPIINQPNVGILGVGMIEKRVKVITDAFGADTLSIRPMAYVSFSFDHRILDGATADAFVMDIKHNIEHWK